MLQKINATNAGAPGRVWVRARARTTRRHGDDRVRARALGSGGAEGIYENMKKCGYVRVRGREGGSERAGKYGYRGGYTGMGT